MGNLYWGPANMKIDTNNLSVMKGIMSSYGWVKGKTRLPIDYKSVPDHICEDFDDDCNDIQLTVATEDCVAQGTYWECWEHDPSCGVCPYLLQEVTENMEKIK